MTVRASAFEPGRYEASARWFTQGLIEHPSAIWANRFRAAAYALSGKGDQARQSLLELLRVDDGPVVGDAELVPELDGLRVTQVRASLC